MEAAEFVRKWRGREGGAERANYALFLSELTEALDLPRPEPADSRSGYRFEYPVRGDGAQPYRIDLYKRDAFILEAKQSRWAGGKNELVGQAELFSAEQDARVQQARRYDPLMRNARNQAWDYANRLPADHDRPPFLIVCDVGRTFELYSDFSGQGRNYRAFPTEADRTLPIERLVEPEAQTLLRAVWTEPRRLDPALRRAEVTREIAAHVAQLSQALEADHAPEEVATFLSRCLFALFAQSQGVGLLREGSVTAMLQGCLEAPDSFMPLATQLFEAMDGAPGVDSLYAFGLGAEVRRFNGAFFKTHRAFPLTREQIGTLIEAAKADWTRVEPAIFGTLLEQALSPADRARLGAHYTPRPYVERLVVATVMEPLREDWDAARAAAEARRGAGDLEGARLEVAAFLERLTRTRVLDPACGTGNFLYVSLELMKALEGEALDALEDLGGQAALGGLSARSVDPRQFFGIELNPRAAAIAELVLWIGHLQASFRRGGYAVRTPVLESFGNIIHADAVLRHDGTDTRSALSNPRRPEWPPAEFIVGNPPFLGGKDVRSELGDAYAQALWAAHPAMNDSADVVMYWWDKAADLLTRKGSALRRFGFVTTNSVTQVFSRRTVQRWLDAKPPVSLIYAVQDHPWRAGVKDAATVRISMTAAESGSRVGVLHRVIREEAIGTDAPVVETIQTFGRINADLTVGVDVGRAKPLLANEGLCSPGVKLHGDGFIVSPSQAAHLGLGREDRPDLDRYIKPYLNGRDLTGRTRGKQVIDLFGLQAEQVRNRYPEVYEHVSRTVRYAYGRDGQPRVDRKDRRLGREWNARRVYKDHWWVFGEPRSELRPALDGLPRFIVTVETAKHRTFSFVDGAVLPDNMLVVIASDDAAHLAVLSSAAHATWSARQGGTLEDRPRYSKSRCFDPFPFPAWTAEQRAELAAKGEALDAFRKARLAETPGLTLTRLYNALEKHRAREAARAAGAPIPDFTAAEAQDATAGAVLILAERHNEIDRLTLAAYGWSDLADAPASAAHDESLLARLVALNAERRAEEARRQVRWLRPAYQIPRLGETSTPGGPVRDLIGDATPETVARAAWPRDGRSRVLAIKGLLAEAAGPVPAPVVAARFKGRAVRPEVDRLLLAMQRDGQIRGAAGGFVLPRPA